MIYYSDNEQRRIISENLKSLIEGCGKDQKQVAFDLEVNPPTFNQWATGKAIPQIHMLRKIAQYFHVSLSDIIDSKQDIDKPENDGTLPEQYAFKYAELNDDRKQVVHKTIETEWYEYKKKLEDYERLIRLDEIVDINDAVAMLGDAAAFGGNKSEEQIIEMANIVLANEKRHLKKK